MMKMMKFDGKYARCNGIPWYARVLAVFPFEASTNDDKIRIYTSQQTHTLINIT